MAMQVAKLGHNWSVLRLSKIGKVQMNWQDLRALILKFIYTYFNTGRGESRTLQQNNMSHDSIDYP